MIKMKKNLIAFVSAVGIILSSSGIEGFDAAKNFDSITVYAKTESSNHINLVKNLENLENSYDKNPLFFIKNDQKIAEYNELDKDASIFADNGIKVKGLRSILKKKTRKPKKSKKAPVDNKIKVSTHYIANTNTKKFHISTCRYVKRMKAKNIMESDNRDDLISDGYVPCKVCNP